MIKDVSGGLNYSIGAIGDASTTIGSLTTVVLTGNFGRCPQLILCKGIKCL